VKLMKKKDDHKYRTKSGPFTAETFTDDFQVHVDAHSASPVFVDDHIQLAMALTKLGVIDKRSCLELTKPPKLQLLLKRQEKQEAQRAAQMEKMIAAGIDPSKKKLRSV